MGSLVALNHPRHVGTVPQIAKVTELPNFTESKIIGIEWLDTKSSKRPRMERSLVPSKHPKTNAHIDDIILYNFQLNKITSTLKKVTREELKRLYDDLKETEWQTLQQRN